MANGRNGRKPGLGRDKGNFVALPWSVLDSAAFAGLSRPARALLLEFARQFMGDNTGRLLATLALLSPRGWRSEDVIHRAKQELLSAGFIYETVKGGRPNRASWYAMTWYSLDPLPGYDEGAAAAYVRGAYRVTLRKPTRPPPKCSNPKKNATLAPGGGAIPTAIAPRQGARAEPDAPPAGAIWPFFH